MTPDKLKHYTISYKFSFYGWIVGAIVIFFIGLAKEYIWDKWMRKGVFDKEDLKYNFLGIWDGIRFKKHRFK